MTIYLGSDHAGYQLKQRLKSKLMQANHRVIDVSGQALQPTDDYPIVAYAVANAVAIERETRGVIICGSAQGVCMVANKVANIRAAVGYSQYAARASRQDDDSNVLCLAGRVLTTEEAWKILSVWLTTPFKKAARFKRRLREIAAIDQHQWSAVEIIPSILVKTNKEFKQRLKKIRKYFALAQIDIADGEFVSSHTIVDWELIKHEANISFDLHLMVKKPEKLLAKIIKQRNIYRVFFHLESSVRPQKFLKLLRLNKLHAGIAINPETPIAELKPYLKLIDAVLVLAVHPGRNGAKFLPLTVKRIKQIRKLRPDLPIVVDGGLNPRSAKKVLAVGANSLVIGSFLEKNKDWDRVIQEFS